MGDALSNFAGEILCIESSRPGETKNFIRMGSIGLGCFRQCIKTHRATARPAIQHRRLVNIPQNRLQGTHSFIRNLIVRNGNVVKFHSACLGCPLYLF